MIHNDPSPHQSGISTHRIPEGLILRDVLFYDTMNKESLMVASGPGILVIILIFGICGCFVSAADQGAQIAIPGSDPREVFLEGGTGPIAENLASASLVITRPPESDRVPYTQRNFSGSEIASIAWWKSPDFMDNTSEFRRYQRATPGQKAGYSEDKRIFFGFIQDSLDSAENRSSLGSDIILFRGIGSSVAEMILTNATYREAAYASTSYDPVVSLDLFGPPDPSGYHTLLVLERKVGEHALYINEDEREYLIPRGSAWQVIKAEEIENLTVETDFPQYNRTGMQDSFGRVRLIYITPLEKEK